MFSGGGVRVSGSGGSAGDARWRVFISHTSELRNFPKAMSYVAAVERAVSAAGHVIVNMADFAAAGQPPARVCAEMVRGCDVYVGVLGTRYGSPVRDQQEVSYTELEFATATEAGLDRLVFLLDTAAADVGIPLSELIDREFGARQDAFRRRVQDSGLLTQSFANPAGLGQLVERALRNLAQTRQRVGSGIRREQVPAEPQPVRASKFVNPPPATAPAWFQGRQVETGLLARYVTDPGIRMVTVTGRGGIGKTATVCRLLKGLEAGRIPDVEGDLAAVKAGGIVYLSSNGAHQVDYPTLVADLLRLLPEQDARRLERLYRDPHQSPAQVMLAVLEAFPAGDPVVVLLDNLESVMDAERETLTEPALHQALTAVLTAPEHAVTVIATTRVTPTGLLKVEPARQHRLPLEEGLGSPDAQIVLRALDGDGHLGLRDAPEELLDGLRRHTRGFPRALEAVKAILDTDDTLTPRDLLDHTRQLPEDQVVQVLVGEAYDLLDAAAQQVMQALAVYPAPVSAVGADFLLQPVNPTTNAAPILTRLVRRQLARFQDGHYYLHPVDRDYARSQLPPGRPGDAPAAFTLTGLQARAADYYAQIRTPRESWRTLEDVRPQLAEFELRCDAGDYDTAATVLEDIDFNYLQVWGHYRTLVALHGRIHGRITDPDLNAAHLTNLGLCHYSLGDYRQAIDLHTQAPGHRPRHRRPPGRGQRAGQPGELPLQPGRLPAGHRPAHPGPGHRPRHRQPPRRGRRAGQPGALPLQPGRLPAGHRPAHPGPGHRPRHRQPPAARATDAGQPGALPLQPGRLPAGHRPAHPGAGHRPRHRQPPGEGTALANLGLCHYSLGDYRQAIDLHTQALAIARDTGDRQGEGTDAGQPGELPLQPGRLPAGHRPAHPGPGHRPRHRRPLRRGQRRWLPGPGLAGVRQPAPGRGAARRGGEHRRHHRRH